MCKELLQAIYLQGVEEQLQNGDPKEVVQTLVRLHSAGCSELEARLLIAECLAIEFFSLASKNETFDFERYVRNLHKLPTKPLEQ